MKTVMFKSPLRVAAALAALLPLLASFPAATLANVKVCRSLDQRYEQIERGASTVEINAMLFSAADKGCLDLAKLLISAGASLEARDRLGAKPLARAAAAGQGEVGPLFLDCGGPLAA